jgi:hypothetical protein
MSSLCVLSSSNILELFGMSSFFPCNVLQLLCKYQDTCNPHFLLVYKYVFSSCNLQLFSIISSFLLCNFCDISWHTKVCVIYIRCCFIKLMVFFSSCTMELFGTYYLSSLQLFCNFSLNTEVCVIYIYCCFIECFWSIFFSYRQELLYFSIFL